MFFVCLSIGIFCLETYPWFRVPLEGAVATNESTSALYKNAIDQYCITTKKSGVYSFDSTRPHIVMQILDYICAAYFTTEYVFRIFFAPRKLKFIRQPLNVIDICCLIPHLVAIILVTINPNDSTSQLFKSMLALRTVRILRIFKLMKHYSAFNILVYTIKVSTRELLLMVIFLFTGVLIFASVMFYVESDTFENIPIGFWWALVTMTTVGYGDKVPKTEGGYIVGCLCVLSGVLTVAFTVPIVVNNFTLYYSHAQSRIKLPPHKRKELKRKLFMKNQKSLDFIDRLRERTKKKKEQGNKEKFTEINNKTDSHRSPPCGEESPPKDKPVTPAAAKFVYDNESPIGITVEEIGESSTSLEKPHKMDRIHTISEHMESSSASPASPLDVEMLETEVI